MKKQQKPSLEQILRTKICDCATVKDIIDTSVDMAFDWHDHAGADLCPTHLTASLMMAIGVYGELLVRGAHKHSGDEGVDRAARLLHDMRALAHQADDDCREYILSAIDRVGTARHLDSLSTDGMTIQ